MATPEEIEETLAIIRNAWHKAPMLRLGQLLGNSASLALWNNPDLFYVEDEVLKNGLKKFIKEVKIHE